MAFERNNGTTDKWAVATCRLMVAGTRRLVEDITDYMQRTHTHTAHAHTHARTHKHYTHTHTHTHTYTRAHTQKHTDT